MRTRAIIHTRSIQDPKFGITDFTEKFESTKEIWCAVKTSSGKSFFSAVNVDVAMTHEIGIRYDPSVTSETWLEIEDQLLDIIGVEDLEERHEFMVLSCAERGLKSTAAAQA